jgi:hypothetical protein
MEGISTSFAEHFPGGVTVICVPLALLDRQLTRMSGQAPDEFWDVGSQGAKARLLWEWVSGKAITPPLIILHDDNLGLIVAGGNNRLAVARAKGAETVPILVKESERGQIEVVLHPDFYGMFWVNQESSC